MKTITLELHPASEPPDNARAVLAFTNTQGMISQYEKWGWSDPDVKWWAEMPGPVEE